MALRHIGLTPKLSHRLGRKTMNNDKQPSRRAGWLQRLVRRPYSGLDPAWDDYWSEHWLLADGQSSGVRTRRISKPKEKPLQSDLDAVESGLLPPAKADDASPPIRPVLPVRLSERQWKAVQYHYFLRQTWLSRCGARTLLRQIARLGLRRSVAS